MITPNTHKLYLYPANVKESFILDGQRYILTYSMALVSDYGRYGMLPPVGKGFYIKISMSEYKKSHALYLEKKQKFLNALNSGYLKAGGVQSTFDF